MRLVEIIELFKSITLAHPELKTFRTQLFTGHNASEIDYPLLALEFPHESYLSADNKVLTHRLTFNVSVNSVTNQFGTYTNTNQKVEPSVLNEATTDLLEENLMRDRSLAIASHVYTTFKELETNHEYLECGSIKFSGIERSGDDFVTGTRGTFEIKTKNSYKCDYIDLLNITN